MIKKWIYLMVAALTGFTLTGCAGVSMATAWSMICASVGAGASVYSASKKTDGKTDEKAAEKTETPASGETVKPDEPAKDEKATSAEK